MSKNPLNTDMKATDLKSGDPVEALIQKCGFTERQIDSATSQYCGIFALALYRHLVKIRIHSDLVLFCAAKNGKPLIDKDQIPYWRHAAVRIGSLYYDMRGANEKQWLIDEFVWGASEAAVMPLKEAQLIDILKRTTRSYDQSYLSSWSDQLEQNQ